MKTEEIELIREETKDWVFSMDVFQRIVPGTLFVITEEDGELLFHIGAHSFGLIDCEFFSALISMLEHEEARIPFQSIRADIEKLKTAYAVNMKK